MGAEERNVVLKKTDRKRVCVERRAKKLDGTVVERVVRHWRADDSGEGSGGEGMDDGDVRRAQDTSASRALDAVSAAGVVDGEA